MQRSEVVGAADAVADVAGLLTDTVRDMHRAIVGRGFDHTARWLGPLVRPVRTVHDAVTAATYATVRAGLTTTLAAGGRAAGARRADGVSVHEQPRASRTVAVLGGIVGDRLAQQGNPLAVETALWHAGRQLPATAEALAAAHPGAGPRMAVFLPGVCETEAVWHHRADEWHAGNAPTHGDRLHADLDLVPLWARYNTGRRVSDTGADVDALLEAVARHWPVPVEQIVLVGYSMGGLVARSALHCGLARRADWTHRVTHVVSLGTPHHGAPMEKLGNTTTWALGGFAQTRALASLFNRRSSGIKDLRFGNVTDADWRGHDPDALLRDTRVPTRLAEDVHHHAVGAAVHGPLGPVVGDGMVRLPSATGRHRHTPLAFTGRIELRGLGHTALRNHPAAYRVLRDVIATGGPGASPRAQAATS